MMKRPMGVVGLALTLATWAAFLFDAEQALYLSLAMLATGLMLLVLSRRYVTQRWPVPASVACLAAAAGFAMHALMEQTRILPFYDAAGEVVQAEGMITEASLGSRAIRYTVTACFPERDDLPRTTMTVRTYGEMEYLAGEVIRCTVKLSPVEQPLSGFRLGPDDVLEGMLQGEPELVEGGYNLQRKLIALREWLCDNVYVHLPAESADIVTAMVLGQDSNVSTEAYSAVSRAGTIHILSVSGMHLSILTAMVIGALGKLRFPPRLRSLIAILVAAAFALLVGFSAPVIRAFTMTAMMLLAGMLGRKRDSITALSVAVTVICIVWPGWVLSWGFWLSAGSTLGILLFGETFYARIYQHLSVGGRLYNRLVKALTGAGAISLAAYVPTLPFLTIFYGWISVLSPLANILIAPFVPIVMVGGILCALTGNTGSPMPFVAAMTDFSTQAILRISEMVSSLPFATLSMDEVWLLVWLAFVVLVLCLLWRWNANRRLVAYGITLLVLVFGVGSLTHTVANHDRMELATIAGCDAAVLLRGSEAVILGTPNYYDVGWLLRYLEYREVDAIRAVVATDSGEQVGSGLLRLADRYPVDCMIGPDDAYILEQMAVALPEIPVYSGGYAHVEVLGGLPLTLSVPDGDILVYTPRGQVRKTAAGYDGEAIDPASAIILYPEDAVVLQGATGLTPTPLGHMLYGEMRFWLN